MKKVVSLALAALMLVSAMLTLTACGSAYPGIEKNFVDAGFKVVDTTDEDGKNYLSFIKTLEEGEISCTIHVLKKGSLLKNNLLFAVIAEYDADKDAAAALDEYLDGGLASTLKDLDESKIVKGNCLLIPINANMDIVNAEENIENMIELFNQ
ncbi:MAG: hypothetical protein IJY20_00090 [Clostridia bacterium]|nr:hypothetical protein [Clostridia bacterium]